MKIWIRSLFGLTGWWLEARPIYKNPRGVERSSLTRPFGAPGGESLVGSLAAGAFRGCPEEKSG